MIEQALCVGKHVLFDSIDPQDHELAAKFCATCPALDACRERLAEVQADAGYYGHPEGTWAGRLHLGETTTVTRRLAAKSRADRLAAEDAAYSIADAKQAHTAYAQGDRSDWASIGHRVYGRRRKRRIREEQALAEAS